MLVNGCACLETRPNSYKVSSEVNKHFLQSHVGLLPLPRTCLSMLAKHLYREIFLHIILYHVESVDNWVNMSKGAVDLSSSRDGKGIAWKPEVDGLTFSRRLAIWKETFAIFAILVENAQAEK